MPTVTFSPSGLSGAGVVNTRAWRAAEIPSTNLQASARGVARVYAALAAGGTDHGAPGVREHDLGRRSPHVLLRSARCVAGAVELEVDFSPRFEYGLTTPLMAAADGGVVATGGPTTLRLSSSVPLEVETTRATARIALSADDTVSFAVHGVSTWEQVPPSWTADDIGNRIEDTTEAWRSWSAAHQRYQGPYRDLVQLSGRVLQGLTFQPTGAIVAAPTTSLPESIGGGRNRGHPHPWVVGAPPPLNAAGVWGVSREARRCPRDLSPPPPARRP